MDITYQKILNIFFRRVDIARCRIVMDDYGIGEMLRRFLNFLRNRGAEVIVTSNSEDKYLEAKVASLISKRHREFVIKTINEKPEFQINGLTVGSGNAGDKKTLKWLKTWYSAGRPWPWFVKRSFKTIREIEGRKGNIEKITPPIDEKILSKDFLEGFNRGDISIQSLSLVCPHCGEILKGARFVILKKQKRPISHLKCVKCGEFIENAGITLRYYCGYILPDSSIIQRNTITQDLEGSRFFEGFTIILSPIVRRECDGTPRGKREFEKLAQFNLIGRIRLNSVGYLSDIPDNLPSEKRDEMIIEDCLRYNAILMTADKSMYAFASGKEIFTIFI